MEPASETAAEEVAGMQASSPPVSHSLPSTSGSCLAAPTSFASRGPSGRPADYSKWDKLGAEEGEEEEEDPMLMPVCSEIPWHNMEPLMNRILDDAYGPDPVPQPTPAEKSREFQQGTQEGRQPPPARAEVSAGDAANASSAGDLRARGNEAFQRRDYPQALALWGRAAAQALEAEDHDLWAVCRANAAQAELRRRRWSVAESLASEVLARFPRHEKALFRRGMAREALGDLDGARQDFIGVVASNFMNCEAQDALSRVQERSRKEADNAS
mmetsp:Transcript_21616/g.64970  ORF Transcript_21616/g.64970 Transcript_21616/m.64970 type:complete len:271 (+) Transcript_21616:79-891(+)